MRLKVLLIINPISGRGIMKQHLLDVISQLSIAGFEISVYPTTAKGDAKTRLEAVSDYDYVIAVGGDGTLNEVISGYATYEPQVQIGYIPTGTTNDFATALGISRTIQTAVEQFITGELMSIDIGSFNEHYFSYVAAFGAFTDVAYETPQVRKNMLGRLAYLVEGLLRLPTITSYHCTIVHDEGTLTGNFVFGMISNSDSVAGIHHAFGQTADLSDGLFEVTLIKMPQNVLDMQQILTDFLNTEYDPDYVISFKTSQIKIQSDTPLKWTLDGEDGGLTTDVAITNLNHKVKIVLPNSQK